jgi:hypothetical protein
MKPSLAHSSICSPSSSVCPHAATTPPSSPNSVTSTWPRLRSTWTRSTTSHPCPRHRQHATAPRRGAGVDPLECCAYLRRHASGREAPEKVNITGARHCLKRGRAHRGSTRFRREASLWRSVRLPFQGSSRGQRTIAAGRSAAGKFSGQGGAEDAGERGGCVAGVEAGCLRAVAFEHDEFIVNERDVDSARAWKRIA